jgi:hypothetical protein
VPNHGELGFEVGLTQNQGPYLINEIAIGFKNIIF